MWAGQFHFRGAYTIFHHTRAEKYNLRYRAPGAKVVLSARYVKIVHYDAGVQSDK